jgi:hypothetical protein
MYKNERKFEYKMPKDYADTILKLRKKEGSKLEPQPYLCEYVNKHFGMMGTCVSVIMY